MMEQVSILPAGGSLVGALFLHSIVERLLHGLRRDYWRSLWTRSREGKGAGWQLLRSL